MAVLFLAIYVMVDEGCHAKQQCLLSELSEV